MSSRPICPYCGSIQTRYASTKSNILASRFSCKNCGQSFTMDTSLAQAKGGCLGLILKALLLAIVAIIFFVLMAALNRDEPVKQSTSKPARVETKVAAPEQAQDNIFDQVFTQEAEKAAHEYQPTKEDFKRIEGIQHSQDKNDTLSIDVSTREPD